MDASESDNCTGTQENELVEKCSKWRQHSLREDALFDSHKQEKTKWVWNTNQNLEWKVSEWQEFKLEMEAWKVPLRGLCISLSSKGKQQTIGGRKLPWFKLSLHKVILAYPFKSDGGVAIPISSTVEDQPGYCYLFVADRTPGPAPLKGKPNRPDQGQRWWGWLYCQKMFVL